MKQFFQNDDDHLSMARLLSFLLILTGCCMGLTASIAVLLNKSGIVALLTAATTFCGSGAGLKGYQKKIERKGVTNG